MPKAKRKPRRVRKMERRKLVRTQKLMAAMDQAVNNDAPWPPTFIGGIWTWRKPRSAI